MLVCGVYPQVFGMGLGNALAGLLGGMGGNAMIGLSVMNCRNGSMGKESGTCPSTHPPSHLCIHRIWVCVCGSCVGVVTALGIFVMLVGGYPALNYIPIASLSGIMFVVVLHTFKWYATQLSHTHTPTHIWPLSALLMVNLSVQVFPADDCGDVCAWFASEEVQVPQAEDQAMGRYHHNRCHYRHGAHTRERGGRDIGRVDGVFHSCVLCHSLCRVRW